MIAANILLTLVVGAALAYLGWTHPPAAWTALQSVGVCLTIAGFVLWTLARFQLGSSLAVTAQAKKLVTRGIYGKFRNPIYYFGSLAIAGFILLLGRPWWLLIFVAILPLQIWRAGVEARVLEEKFGEEYRNYRARTWF
jgi:protein-S-isoprenylcysteine O-methyltransferase Ste14